MSHEMKRLEESQQQNIAWKKWGPYLSERQWGTVREDYSDNGDAWGYFSHDQARSRAYLWGEDGLAGLSDDKQYLCFGLALWNGTDSIIKERLFGLTNSEGNHGEDVKEYYFYLDSTPTHSYMKYLYKYPQLPFPYEDLVKTNGERSRHELEYELLDTGVFDEDRYFDVFVEYAKESPEDILILISIANRGSEPATLHVLPSLWFRNIWCWRPEADRPTLNVVNGGRGLQGIAADHPKLGQYYLYADGKTSFIFTENETNNERIFGVPNQMPFVKDGINNYVVHGQQAAVNPNQTGTKAAAHYPISVAAGETQTIRLRLTTTAPKSLAKAYPGGKKGLFGTHFDSVLAARRQEADEFYATLTPRNVTADEALVMRQALAGMLWSKQFYYYDVNRWRGNGYSIPNLPAKRSNNRNQAWFHMVNEDIISMPDKWEYPWYAAWDLAFHTIALNMVDPDFAKDQLELMVCQQYLHPNGQIPAYEWNFSDVNPPVHAWAAYFIYWNERELHGQGDLDFLKRIFQKLLLNFTWWVNRKDTEGNNVFEGGFLGLDNIGVFDRSAPLPMGGRLDQADGTAWMAFYCQMMLEIALELAMHDRAAYEELACKFYEHFLWIVAAMDRIGVHEDELWDEEDGFFYDVLRFPDGRGTRLKVRSLVGLLSLAVSTVITSEMPEKLPDFMQRVRWYNENRPELVAKISGLHTPGVGGRRLLAILDDTKLRQVLAYMLDENEFLSDYGIRALSRYHLDHPYIFSTNWGDYRVDYEPAESTTGLFGGNSNWRGPIWMPMNALLIRGLISLYGYYGDDFQVECPTGSGRMMNLWQVSQEISRRLTNIFVRNDQGRRPVYGDTETFQTDPHWRDYILFYEYFHGDNGAGIGASHQTGWTGLVAKLIQLFGDVSEADLKDGIDKEDLIHRVEEAVPN
ncbi:MAG: glucosidase [Anaerolineales bacterium]|nr:glucosidase [Anaerolineales bacterium]